MSRKIKQFTLIREWAIAKGILPFGDIKTQALKTTEELGETCKAIIEQDLPAVKDGIGDVMVTLILLADMHNLTAEECLEAAWNEIKDRTGKMENGTFIRDKE